ncbi:MAG: hypothetical protein PWQ67_533 [Clostridia bacterium]|jgi:hypothetical protein|nr:hypothetical protein [Clostridia bacterium]MDN5322079.1 hypothetical protein [Clostridia bacterium]
MKNIQRAAELLDLPIKSVKLFVEMMDAAQSSKKHYAFRPNAVSSKINIEELFDSLVEEYDRKL